MKEFMVYYRMIMIIDNLRVPLNLPIIVIELKITLTGETFCPEVDRIITSSGSSVLPINKVDILNIIRGEQLLVIGQNSILPSCIIPLCAIVNTKSTNPVVGKTTHCK